MVCLGVGARTTRRTRGPTRHLPYHGPPQPGQFRRYHALACIGRLEPPCVTSLLCLSSAELKEHYLHRSSHRAS